ncbi:MAG TPA: ATP-dependent RecD-like DNA helicase [Gemmatimonadales bacterium]|nr:ATP-dependent RecD-like DNA helicase [Gemmatimonadales bacterium]
MAVGDAALQGAPRREGTLAVNSRGPSAATEALAGWVERVTFHNEDTGFCVLRVKLRGQRDLMTLVGHAATISAGEFVQATGEWINDRTHGVQFKATSLQVAAPTTVEGIEKYLGSGMIRGIGPAYAGKLTRAFGETVFEVIEQAPERLREVTGIGPKRATAILAGWAEQRSIREIMLFLHSHGVGTSRSVRIYKTYGAQAVALISDNPYRLAQDIQGIGFRTADRIAATLGVAPDSLLRIRAGISFALGEALGEGHCGLPRADLLTATEKLLGVPAPLVATALALELEARTVIADQLGDGEGCFLAGLYNGELEIAATLKAQRQGRPPWPDIDPDKAIPWVEGKTGLALAPSQQAAVRVALASKVLVITGGPGVGKTTLVNSLLKIVTAKRVTVALAAPTGRAAKRLSESTGLEAKTIHRLLETDPKTGGFRRNADHPLECDLIVVDETSMVDVPLMRALTRALPSHAALWLVGDVDQLPSVGPGQVLADIIESGAVEVVRLTEVFRQAAESRIIVNAHRINRGMMPEFPDDPSSDCFFVEAEEPEIGVARILEIVRERIPRRFGLDPICDIQVLCPMNRGGLGARSLNLELQNVLNPPGERRVERFGYTFGQGDKVMQTLNDYDKDVYNGDLGIVTDVDDAAGELAVAFDGRTVSYRFGELDALVLAYATTIHKSQGSEYPAVVIPVTTQHYLMLKRQLLYTGVTRGKRLVVLVGMRKALAIAVKASQTHRRWSKLKDHLLARAKAL